MKPERRICCEVQNLADASPVANIASVAMEVQESGCSLRCIAGLPDQEHVQLSAIPVSTKTNSTVRKEKKNLAFMKRLSKGRLKMAGVGTKTRE